MLQLRFQGGVDSTLLLAAACEALGQEHVYVFHGVSELVSQRDRKDAAALLDEMTINAERIQRIRLNPLEWPDFIKNGPDRCYLCKKRMYHEFLQRLDSLQCSVLLDGSNADDLKSERPGFRAIKELGIKTPLLDAGLTKKEIRFLAECSLLRNHDRASNSCLATRLPSGKAIEASALTVVEKSEDFLFDRGFSGCRVRPKDLDIILEIAENDFSRTMVPAVRVEITGFFKSLGFSRVLVDLTPRL